MKSGFGLGLRVSNVGGCAALFNFLLCLQASCAWGVYGFDGPGHGEPLWATTRKKQKTLSLCCL